VNTLLKIWRNPLFRTVLGLYTIGMLWVAFILVTQHYFTQLFGLSPLGIFGYLTLVVLPTAGLVSWLIVLFASNAVKKVE